MEKNLLTPVKQMYVMVCAGWKRRYSVLAFLRGFSLKALGQKSVSTTLPVITHSLDVSVKVEHAMN